MAFPWVLAIPVIQKLLGGGGGEASDIAAGMSEEQRAILRQAMEMGDEFLLPLLRSLQQQAESPYEDPWEKALWERTRGEIERGFRPGYASGLADLSRRHMLTEPSSVLGPYTASMDRARGGAVAEASLARMAGQRSERQRALETFSNALAQARGGNVQVAGAYDQPIRGMTDLSQQAASPTDWLAGLTRLYELQKRGKGPGAGVAATGAPGATTYNPNYGMGTPPTAYR